MKQFRDKRYYCKNQFYIQYFPKNDRKRRECTEIAERLMQCLEYITPEEDELPVRGTKPRYEVIEGVLNFYINYDYFVIKTDEQSALETIEIKSGVKEGV